MDGDLGELGSSKRAVMIGLGGIGSWLVQALSPMLSFDEEHQWTLVLVDGDKYTNANLSRQAFNPADVGCFKSDAQARWILKRFPNIQIGCYSEYLTGERNRDKTTHVASVIRESDIVLLAVDNHKTRKLVSDRCSQLENCTLLSAGNDDTYGNVQVYLRRGGVDVTPPLGAFHPEITDPRDKAPFEKSCEELAQSEPQILATNLMAASIMLNSFWGLIRYGDPSRPAEYPSEVYFDILANKASPKWRKVKCY